MKITWPSPQDYNEAVQNPRLCFLDDDLREAQPELNQLGLPKPATGNFATVYRLTSRQKSWAVRCFVQAAHDCELRYQHVSQQLSKLSINETVGFEYLPNGIQVRGRRFPLLKMEWVDGASLDNFIRCHHKNSAVMFSLAQRFVLMALELGRNGVAHGDLQHGNIMVCADGIRLIDYDGMYVPRLNGLSANETGHRHYQHPLRGPSHFGPYLDHFSQWVVFVSLYCLGVDPTLWDILGAGDECLLFRDTDFLAPHQSQAFAVLSNHSQSGIKNLGNYLRSLTELRPERMPALDPALLGSHDYSKMNMVREVEQTKQASPAALWQEPSRAAQGIGVSNAANSTTAARGGPGRPMTSSFFRQPSLDSSKGNSQQYQFDPNLPFAQLVERATNAFHAGRFDEAAFYYNKVVSHTSAGLQHNQTAAARAQVHIGYCHISLNEADQALQAFKRAQPFIRRIEEYDLEVRCLCGMGIAYMLKQDATEALKKLHMVPSKSDLRAGLAALFKGPLGESIAFGDLLWAISSDCLERQDFDYALCFCENALEAYQRALGHGSDQVRLCAERQVALSQRVPAKDLQGGWDCNYCKAINIISARSCYNCQRIRIAAGHCITCGAPYLQCTCWGFEPGTLTNF
jgi:tetratricopeptide (TPR) repeat protein